MSSGKSIKTGAWTFGELAEADTPFLYHYRSGKSMKRIFDRDGVLFRFKRGDKFKDKMEGKAVEEYYCHAVEELLSEKRISEGQYHRFKDILPPGIMLSRIFKADRAWYVRQEYDPFILCFSTEEDNSYLYNQIDNKGSGCYYFSMDTTVVRSLKGYDTRNGVRFAFGKVLYGNDIEDHIQSEIIKVLKTPYLHSAAEAYLHSYLHSLQFMAKESQYEPEKEVRIVISVPKSLGGPLPDIIFDEKREYLTLKIPKSYVISIVPKEDNEKTVNDDLFVELKSRGYPQAEHYTSQ